MYVSRLLEPTGQASFNPSPLHHATCSPVPLNDIYVHTALLTSKFYTQKGSYRISHPLFFWLAPQRSRACCPGHRRGAWCRLEEQHQGCYSFRHPPPTRYSRSIDWSSVAGRNEEQQRPLVFVAHYAAMHHKFGIPKLTTRFPDHPAIVCVFFVIVNCIYRIIKRTLCGMTVSQPRWIWQRGIGRGR